mgnify:CR=1 FL=1
MSTIAYSVGIISMSVCTTDSEGDMLAVINAEYPTGLDHGWTVSKSPTFRNGEPNGKVCEDDCRRRHFLLEC